MKKLKEFLFFPLAIILLLGIFLALFLFSIPDSAFYSGGQYIKLMIQDKLFISALVNTFSIPLIISAVISILSIAVMVILKWKKKMVITRNNFYLTLGLLSTGASFAHFAIFTNALTPSDEMNVTLQMTAFAVIFSIIVAILLIFVVWLIEQICFCIIKIIRKHKESKAQL